MEVFSRSRFLLNNFNLPGFFQVFKQPWPGIMRTVYGNHERFETTYFKKFPGYYTTGDGTSDFFN